MQTIITLVVEAVHVLQLPALGWILNLAGLRDSWTSTSGAVNKARFLAYTPAGKKIHTLARIQCCSVTNTSVVYEILLGVNAGRCVQTCVHRVLFV